MGWFEELIAERKKKNQEILESSMKNISSSVFGPETNDKTPVHIALTQIYKFYRLDRNDVPEQVNKLSDELDLRLGKFGLQTRRLYLERGWQKETNEPIIAFTHDAGTPVALFPKGHRYYFVHPLTEKKVLLTSEILAKFDPEALTFYRPLPRRKLTMKDYDRYIRSNVRLSDAILVLVLLVLVAGVGMISPYLTRTLMGEVIETTNYSLFLSTALFLAGVSLTALLLKTTQAIINARLYSKVENSMHASLLMHLLSLPPSFFQRYNTGELNRRVSSVTALCYLLINGIFIGGLSALLGLLYLIQIAGFSTALILPSLGVVAANLAFMILTSFLERSLSRKQNRLGAKESGVAYDLINGIQKIRLTGSEKRAFAKWTKSYSRSARAYYNPPLLIKLAPVFSALISASGTVLIYFLVAKNEMDVGTYLAFNVSYGALSTALLSLSNIVGNAVRVKPLLEMISPILEEEPESGGDKPLTEELQGGIVFDHVSFRYDDKSPLVLNDLSLSIKPGEYVAIVGKTGCGKSTIIRLLLGFEMPNEGHVYFDEYDVSKVDLPSLRRKIGSVTQNGSLFHADILHNITISAPELGEKEAWEAASIARIDKDIEAMPMKMHTVISEGQGSISGGQKQRLMIARAIVHKPKIILFDEATSALDNQCQKEVTESIGKLSCTRVVIAHRLSTIKDCDRILYLENGRIVEEGTYDELLALGGKFQELIKRQSLE